MDRKIIKLKKKHYTDNQRLINKGNSRIPLFLRQHQTLLNRLRIQVLLNSQQFLLHIVASVLFMGSINLFIIMSQLRKKGKIMLPVIQIFNNCYQNHTVISKIFKGMTFSTYLVQMLLTKGKLWSSLLLHKMKLCSHFFTALGQHHCLWTISIEGINSSVVSTYNL